MVEFTVVHEAPAARFSLRSLLGVHSIAAGVCQFVFQAPVLAAIIAAIGVFLLLQAAVVAACTWHMPRG
jgi:hypothetical protein